MDKKEFQKELEEVLKEDFNIKEFAINPEIEEAISKVKNKAGSWLSVAFNFPKMVEKAEKPKDYLFLYALAISIRKNGFAPLTGYSIELNHNLIQENA